MSRLHLKSLVGTLILVLGAVVAPITGSGGGLARMLASTQPRVAVTTLNVDCKTIPDFDETWIKLCDIGTFDVQTADSVVEIDYHGRIYVGSFAGGATGARFQLRIDDVVRRGDPRVRARVHSSETGVSGVPASMTGIYDGLSVGEHTLSMWVQGVHGGGTTAGVDPGCWSTDHVVIKEFLPLWATFVPVTFKD